QLHWEDYGQVRTKKGLAQGTRRAAPEDAGPPASLRDAAAGHAHLAGQPPRHGDRRVLAYQRRVRSAPGTASMEGRWRTAGRAATASHRPARHRQAA